VCNGHGLGVTRRNFLFLEKNAVKSESFAKRTLQP